MVKKGSKIFESCSGGIPFPLSLIDTWYVSGASFTMTDNSPLSYSIDSIAFTRIFEKAICNFDLSAKIYNGEER